MQTELFEQHEEVSTEYLDELVLDMQTKKQDYDRKKAISNEADALHKESRSKVVATLQAAGKKKYHVDDVGTVSVTEKLKVQVPKSPEDKAALFKWLKESEGTEGFLTYASVNYQSLQSLYNMKFEEAKEQGVASEFEIPGVGNPTEEYGLSFRK